MVHHLDIEQDDRKVFPIEMFGFYEEGVINITVADFSVADSTDKLELGIMLRAVDSQSAAQTLIEVRAHLRWLLLFSSSRRSCAGEQGNRQVLAERTR
jgi:hypothetical protein